MRIYIGIYSDFYKETFESSILEVTLYVIPI